jgi:hypothetical protein
MNKCPKEYGGPTINGKPVLSIEEVQQWFKEADCDASFDNAKSIAQALNHCGYLPHYGKTHRHLRQVAGTTRLSYG